MTNNGNRPSKWGHTLDDTEITLLIEPKPGTQFIYEYISDCSDNVAIVFPPNSTVILNNPCDIWIQIFGEVTKLVVEKNRGMLDLGSYGYNEVDTE